MRLRPEFLILLLFTCILALVEVGFSSGLPARLLALSGPIFVLLFVTLAGIENVKYPGYTIFLLFGVARYLVLPFYILLSGIYQNDTSYLYGILLFLFEETVTGVFFVLLSRRFYGTTTLQAEKLTLDRNVDPSINRMSYVFVLIVLLAGTIIALNPSSLGKYNFVWEVGNEDLTIAKYGENIVGIPSMVIGIARLLLPVLLVSGFVARYRRTGRRAYYFLTAAVMFLFNLMIFEGTSRNSAIIPGTAVLFFLVKVFPGQRRQSWLLSGALLLTVLIVLTMFKNDLVDGSFAGMSGTAQYLDTYLAGPRNLSIAVLAYQNYASQFNSAMLFNDLFHNVPGLSALSEGDFRTTTLFNIQAYGGGLQRDAIIPTVGQGLFYFGPFLAVLLQPILLLVVALFDRGYAKSKTLVEAYMYAYFAVACAGYAIHNLSLTMGLVCGTALPMMLLMRIDRIPIVKREIRGAHKKIR